MPIALTVPLVDPLRNANFESQIRMCQSISSRKLCRTMDNHAMLLLLFTV